MRPRSFLSGVAQMRIGMLSAPPSRHWKSPTAIATRYDDILGVVANLSVCRDGPGPGISESSAPLEIAVSPRAIVSVRANVAFIAGSSKQGNVRRASVDSSWGAAQLRPVVLLR